jgi:chitodextrinase
VTAQSVRLVKASDGQAVAGTRGTSGGGDTVTFTPTAALEANTAYRFEVSDQLHDLSGASFVPFAGTFTTGTRLSDDGTGESSAAFTKVTLPTATAPQYHGFTSLAFGPDGKLYGARNDGQIRRWAVNADGTLGDPELIDSLTQKEGGSRLLIGMRFDPSSTPANPVAWVSHTTYGFDGMPDWGGKITRLSGANLQNVQDYVVGLPRSARDHVTNGIDIGPDGALYFTQGSNSAMGRADSSWGNRPERLLNAAVLRLDPTKVTNAPVDVKTEEGGSYNPFAAGAPLTVFASGVRNAYDLAWHSNGQLYVPTNGSAAGGNTPATPSPLPASCQKRLDGGTFTGPSAPALTGVSQTQHDFLFRAVQGGYYGHPNPTRCEWTLNGGNPTSGSDAGQVDAYPAGTQPDPNWRGAAFDFGLNKSPNGVTEYRNASVFGGSLAGKLLVLRYSNNDDVIALTPGGQNKDIVASQTGIPGTSGFKDPLDIVEQPGTGNLYVSEYDQLGSGPKITLLKVNDSTPQPQACSPVSTLPCAAVKVTMPRMLNWSSDHGALLDKDNQGTGFTMVQPSSNGGAFKPELLDMDPATGRFTITTTKGIQYKTATGTPPSSNNNLDNGVGVGVSDAQPLRFETTLAGFPNADGKSEQAGLWFGPGEDDYVKLVVASTGAATQRVQLLREVGGVSAGQPSGNDEVNLDLPSNIEGSEPIRLRLEVDPAGTARAWYALGSGELQELPGQLTLPAGFFDGSKVADTLEAKGIENFGGVFATHRNSLVAGSGLRFAFDDFGVEQNRGPNRAPVVDAIADRTSVEGEVLDVHPQATDPDGDTLTWSATGLPNGLSINPATGAIGGTIVSGAARPQPYAVTITVTDGFGGEASESFDWTVTPETLPNVEQLKVNFQNAAAAIPDGYVRDHGLPYGSRSAPDQDGTGRATPAAQAGLRYGWIVPGTATPLDLSVGGTTPGNGRDRNVALVDQRYDTLMHMQADDVVSSTFNGTPLPGSWELALPDGSYDVTVAAGDPNANNADPERHALSVEGEPALDFTPSGLAGSETRRRTATVDDVEVTDGRLTLLATGENTKVNFIEINRSEPNQAPEVEPIANQSDREGAQVDLDVEGSDPEDGTLTWSASGLPAGLEIDPGTGRIGGTIAPGAANGSPYTVTITATDDGTPQGKTDVSFEWTVTDATAPGTVANLAATAGDRKVELSWENPSDADFEAVRVVRTTGAPADSPEDGDEVYEGTGTTATAGGLANGTEYTFTVFARDEAGNWSEGRSTTSTPRNLVPVVEAIADQDDIEGDEVDLDVEGSDPEHGTLTWSATGLPAGLTINPGTGRISGTIATGAADDSPYTVTVTAADDGTPQRKTEVSFDWTVTDETAPGPVADLAATPGDRRVELSWINPDGDFEAVRVVRTTGAASGPEDGVEVYEGNGTTATAGGLANGTEYTFTVFARDEAGNWSEAESVEATPRHQEPTVDAIGDRSDRERASVDFRATGRDPEGGQLSWSAVGLPEGVEIDEGTGRITGTIAAGAADHSPYAVTVTATDDGTPQPLKGEARFDWVVTDGVAPGPVTGLQAAPGDRQVELSWHNPGDGDLDLVRVVRTIGAASGPEDGDEVYEGKNTAAKATGLVNGTKYTFTAFVRDTAGNWSEAESVEATPRHQPPTVDPIANQTTREGTRVSLQLKGSDPEGGTLTWSATGLPEGLTIEGTTGRIQGTVTPGTARKAPYEVRVTVSDDGTPQPLTDEAGFSWTVTAAPAPTPKPTTPPPSGNPKPKPTKPTPPPAANPAPPAGDPKPARVRAKLRLASSGPLARQPVVAVRLRGRLTGASAARRTITIECATVKGRWKKAAKTRTTRDGKFGVRIKRQKRPVRCRARFAGDRLTRPALSSPRRIASIASVRQAHKR